MSDKRISELIPASGLNGDDVFALEQIGKPQTSKLTLAALVGFIGTAGNASLLYGRGVPGAGLGKNGDTYIDLAAAMFYKKNVGIWQYVDQMQTPSGSIKSELTGDIEYITVIEETGFIMIRDYQTNLAGKHGNSFTHNLDTYTIAGGWKNWGSVPLYPALDEDGNVITFRNTDNDLISVGIYLNEPIEKFIWTII